MKAKQTGPDGTVKALASLVFTIVFLAGCAAGGGWVNANRTAAETRADEQTCNDQAQEDTLLRTAGSRADHRMPPGAPGPGTLGTSPMEMKDRSAATKDFNRGVQDCMEAKGYTRGRANQG